MIIIIYLIGNYVYFFDFLGQKHLAPPPHETKTLIGTHPGNRIIKYVALGDSLTAGVGASDYQNSYPYLLAQKLSAQNNVELWNFSQSGARSDDVLTKQLPQALSAKPNLVTLFIGINDIHGLKSLTEFKNNYNQIVSALQKNGAKVYLLSIPYLGSDKIVLFPYNLIWAARTKQFNEAIKKAALEYRAVYIDLYPLTKSAQFYSADQFHPSDQGYKEWLKVINVD